MAASRLERREQKIVLALTLFANTRFLLVAGRFRRALQSFQHLIEAEAAWLLARREFLEGSEELPDVLLRRHKQEGMVNPPASIVYAFVVSGLERIGAQVE